MNNTNNKVIWMMDETIANSHPDNWGQVHDLEEQLVGLIANPSYDHEIVHPIPCLQHVAQKIQGDVFTCMFDLTGWLSPAMQELFPDTPIENGFSLSRVREVSSSRLETTGYEVNMSTREISIAAAKLDLTKPLIVDDVSFSGWTSKKLMDMWELDPETTTHAFLIANTGDFGSGNNGAVQMLESFGCRVVTGYEIQTPHEDGWHLKDLHQHPHLPEAFSLSLHLQDLFFQEGIDSPKAQEMLCDSDTVSVLFPNCVSTQEINILAEDEKFVMKNGATPDTHTMHVRNPFLWASPYFQQHIDLDAVRYNQQALVEILEELRYLTTDPEGKIEASLELKNEVRIAGLEGNRERLHSASAER